ncbi:MAG: GrdX family protein [Candidatus Adiutrix sp.]|jgi:hypothetical protein|nr:GrdX family protein [Candidatus Adiutrix sp.]
MGELLVLTNNPLVIEALAEPPVQPVAGRGLAVVFRAALELVQAGYRLVSAPLPPNVPLIRAPYRSLLLAKAARQYDLEGLRLLELARERAETLGRPAWAEEQARDAAIIDRELLARALTESRAFNF